MATVSFTGVGSGTDWSTLISQLVQVEKAPATTLATRKSDAQSQLSLVGDMVSRLQSLGTLTQSYTAPNATLYTNTTNSSDTSRVAATAVGAGTATGSYTMTVNKLAQGETRLGKNFDTSTAGSAGTGTINIGVGTGTQVAVDYSATDSLADIASRINTNVPGVSATVIYDGSKYHMTLNSSATGKVNALNISETGSGLGLDAADSIKQAADDASVTINNVTATSASNQITDMIPGVTLDLRSTTPAGGTPTLVSVARDPSSVTQKLKDLISSYNNIAQLVGSQLSFTPGSTRGQDTLFGDPIISNLQRELGGVVAQAFTHGSGQVSARDLGITLQPDGSLALDETKLSAKLASDPTAASDLLTGPNGLAASINTMTKNYTSTAGPLLSRQQSLNDVMKNYDKQIQEINDRGDQMQTRLKAQFAALDELMANFTSSQSALSNITSVR